MAQRLFRRFCCCCQKDTYVANENAAAEYPSETTPLTKDASSPAKSESPEQTPAVDSTPTGDCAAETPADPSSVIGEIPVGSDSAAVVLPSEVDQSSEQTQEPIMASTTEPVHFKCRGDYPLTDVKRFAVDDSLVNWVSEFVDYAPVEYTTAKVLEKPVWADVCPGEDGFIEIKFNALDEKVNRASHNGEYTVQENGLPRNPMGRTGMTGRGLLGRWGPNHAADPIVTRWKRSENGGIVKQSETDQPILEFVAIQRHDTQEWAIPGGMVDAGECVSLTLKREFGEEALNSLELDAKEETKKHIDDLFSKGETIYKGYVDDPRNTDNAWMETVAVNFHDDVGNCVGRIPLNAGDDAKAVRWLSIDKKLELYASHADFVEKTCRLRNAYFVK